MTYFVLDYMLRKLACTVLKRIRHEKTVFFLLFCLSTTAFSHEATYWQDLLQKADTLYAEGRYKEALEMYQRIAEETASSYAQFQIAWIYDHGLGVKQNCKEAARWYTHAANQGDTAAMNNLAALYSKGCQDLPPNKNLALFYLKKAAEAGLSRAQANLARLYASGEWVEKNEYLAFDWAQKSASQEDISGIIQLAIFYIEGIGVPVNYRKAYSLLSKAATMEVEDWDRGSKQIAQFLLAQMFYEGKGVPKNPIKAYQWFLLAASGENEAISKEAVQYMKELQHFLPKEAISIATEKAYALVRENTEASDADLVTALIQAFSDDRKEDALRLAKILVERGNSTGEWILGIMYLNGYGDLPKDTDEAYILFKRACNAEKWIACIYQADVLIKKGQIQEANLLLDDLISKAPNDNEIQIRLANLCLALGRDQEAEKITRKVLINNPTYKPAKELLKSISEKP